MKPEKVYVVNLPNKKCDEPDRIVHNFMVLWTSTPVRWIPISGNSKVACIDALVDNLW